jgi:hypothetical protein
MQEFLGLISQRHSMCLVHELLDHLLQNSLVRDSILEVKDRVLSKVSSKVTTDKTQFILEKEM